MKRQCHALKDDLTMLMLERQLDRGTESNYRRSITFYSDFLGRPATRCDLTELSVNKWLRYLESKKAPPTVLGHKRSITVLWNWLAAKNHVVAYNPRNLRSIKVRWKPPRAWSVADVKALIKAAEQMTGRLRCGILVKDLMLAWVSVAYQAGLRPGDMRIMEKDAVDGRRLFLIQNKTKQPVVRSLTEDTANLIGRILRDDQEAVFGIPKSTIRRYELRLFLEAEQYGFKRLKGQSIGTLRKTCATEIARLYGPEAAARSLGHVSGSKIALTHYIQPDALEAPIAPPDLTNDLGNTTRTTTNNSAASS